MQGFWKRKILNHISGILKVLQYILLIKSHLIWHWRVQEHQRQNIEVNLKCLCKVSNINHQPKRCFKLAWKINSIWLDPNLELKSMLVKTLTTENLIIKFILWLLVRKKVVKIILLMFIHNFIKNKIQMPNMKSYLIGQKILREEENF